VPYRRGREKSRSPQEIIDQVDNLASSGTVEVTLLGQNVNSYGNDLQTSSDLSSLLRSIDRIDGLSRIRFLTNHPKDMGNDLVRTMASLYKVCKQINLPVQSGNNAILQRMNRGYTRENYLELVAYMKGRIPEISLSTDVIVGFPGETDTHFRDTINLLAAVRFDVVHCAIYSPRPGTLASLKYSDDVPAEVKRGRWLEVENIQSRIAMEINSGLVGSILPVLVEGKKQGRWFGRTGSNKLVFMQSAEARAGQTVNARVIRATAWSLQAQLED
jgi:tRNA-2-methylthio-N6-dimethylallyladenosine synthase